MRSESVDLLRSLVMQRMRKSKGLSRPDVEFIVHAMEIVSSHPVSTFDMQQSGAGIQRQRDIWASMERKLFALEASAKDSEACMSDS